MAAEYMRILISAQQGFYAEVHLRKHAEVHTLKGMPRLPQIIRELMESLNENQAEFGARFGLNQTTVSRWLGGSKPDYDVWSEIEQLWRAEFGGPSQYLNDGVTTLTQPPQIVPLISWVEVGNVSFADDPYPRFAAEEWVRVDYPRETLIALRVQDNSMNRIAHAGAIIVVDFNARELISGQLYLIRDQSGSSMFRRFRPNPDRFEPFSTEPHEIYFPEGEVYVVGHVVDIHIDPRIVLSE